MFGSSILEIAIGLIFIFFLYSLLTVSVFELFANLTGLKARLLRQTIIRMLTDDDELESRNHSFKGNFDRLKCKFISFIYFFFKVFKKNKANKTTLATFFYETPHIKYLGLGNWYKRPTAIEPKTFAETLTFILSMNGNSDSRGNDSEIEDPVSVIDRNLLNGKIPIDNSTLQDKIMVRQCTVTTSNNSTEELVLDPKTLKFLRDKWQKANKDKANLEKLFIDWFNETIEQLKIKYKLRAQINTFILGLLIAITLNVDTISIVNLLSSDSNTRAQIIEIANQYRDLGEKAMLEEKGVEVANPIDSTTTKGPKRAAAPTPISTSTGKSVKQSDENEDLEKSRELLTEVYAVTQQKNNLLAFGWAVPKNNLELAKQISDNSIKTITLDSASFNKLKKKPRILGTVYNFNNKKDTIKEADLTYQYVIIEDKYALKIIMPIDPKAVETSALAFQDPLRTTERSDLLITLANRSAKATKRQYISKRNPTIEMVTIPPFKAGAFFYKVWFVLSQLSDLTKLAGLIITAIAISLGAPFWYDLLSKIISLKSGKTSTTTTIEQK